MLLQLIWIYLLKVSGSYNNWFDRFSVKCGNGLDR
jgi:hypothetical protein